MTALIFSLLSIATIAEVIFTVIFLQLYMQRKQAIYLYFTIFTGVALFWNTGVVLMSFANSTTAIFIGYWMFLIAPMLSTLFILFFSQQFMLAKRNNIYIIPVIAIIIYAVILQVNNKLITINLSDHFINTIHPNKLFYIFYALYFIVYFQLSMNTLRKHTKDSNAIKRSQAKNLVYGTGFTGTPGIITNIVLPALGVTYLIWVGPIFSLVFLSFSAIAITRHKLFDVRNTIVRSTAYFLSISLLIAAYTLIFVGILGNTALKNASISTVSWVFIMVVIIVITIAFAPLKRFFDKITKMLFYQDAYDSQTFISQLNQHLVSDIHLNSLLQKCSDVIIENLKVEFCSFGLKQTENLPQQIIGTYKKRFKQADIEKVRALTPATNKKIIITDELEDEHRTLKALLVDYEIGVLARLATNVANNQEGIGYIVLGYKKSGSTFNSADSAVLEIIANELVIAIQNAMQFEEIQQFNVTLQKKIEESTHELQRTNKKLVALDEAKDEFISMASHQLRTPLTSVKGYISMLVDGDFGKITPRQEEILKDAFVSSQRMVFLISDFLNVSRLKTGKFIIEPAEVYLPEIVQEEINQLREMAVSRDLKIEYTAPKIFPKVMLDENKIRQVMMNFVDNAIYYTPAGGKVRVELYTTKTDVVYKVIDSGIGVPKAEQHRLFTKFFRAKNAQKARPDGTGLGIFMAQKVIIGQGGNIIFESAENKGSTFGFKFPISKIKVKQ